VAVKSLTQTEIYCTLFVTEAREKKMQPQNWRRTITTMYVSEAEYQLIMSKAETLDVSASKFTKQAVTTYIKHLEKHLENAEPVAA
jgi:hypothetical protein